MKDEEEEKKEEKISEPIKKEFDLFLPKEFGMALEEKIQRPFIFGPIEFTNLSDINEPFRDDLYRQYIKDILVKTPYLPENLCLHGFKVAIKKRTLKRKSTVIKHSRFLRNLEVYPLFPPEPEVAVIEENAEGEEILNEDEDD